MVLEDTVVEVEDTVLLSNQGIVEVFDEIDNAVLMNERPMPTTVIKNGSGLYGFSRMVPKLINEVRLFQKCGSRW